MKVDFAKPIYVNFKEQPSIKAFVIGQLEDGTWLVGIPDPNNSEGDTGITVNVNDEGKSVNSGRQIISNEE